MVPLNRIDIIGGGPAGLYAAILLKQRMPASRVRVSERNPADATAGFGVVFSDRALDFLRADDADTHALITPLMQRWRDITLSIDGETVVLDGIGFAAIGRLTLLRVLQQRAAALDVELCFEQTVESIDAIEAGADLVIGADGLNSILRRTYEPAFAPSIEYCANRFAWFGTTRHFPTLTQTFIRSERGALNAHHYRYAEDMSTFIVECDPRSFDALGFDGLDERASAEICSRLFSEALDGAELICNRSEWRQFPRLWCDNWVHGNRVLIGDAAHSAHFSVGSGTRLALEDALALANALTDHDDIDQALAAYQQLRQPLARKIVDAASASACWYDDFAGHMQLPPLEFAHAYLSRSGRIDAERLRQLSPAFMRRYDQATGRGG